jgi:hypothetical protein
LTGGTDHLVVDAEPAGLYRASDGSNAGGDQLAKRRQPYVSCLHGHRVSYEFAGCEISCNRLLEWACFSVGRCSGAVTGETSSGFVSSPRECHGTRKGAVVVDWTSRESRYLNIEAVGLEFLLPWKENRKHTPARWPKKG